MPPIDESKKLANRVIEIVAANMVVNHTWGYPMFDAKFEDEPELRNKVFLIWLYAVLDTAEAANRELRRAIEDAVKIGADHIADAAEQLRGFSYLACEAVQVFSREEQINFFDVRNQFVHGYLHNRHRDEVSVRYAENGTVVREKLPFLDYNEIVRNAHGGRNLDDTLSEARARFFDLRLGYWVGLSFLERNNAQIYSDLLEGREIDTPFEHPDRLTT
jgi:hypothetical protein